MSIIFKKIDRYFKHCITPLLDLKCTLEINCYILLASPSIPPSERIVKNHLKLKLSHTHIAVKRIKLEVQYWT